MRSTALTLGAVLLVCSAEAQVTAPYRSLDEVRGAWVDLMATPVRPMAWHPVTGNLWAVNAHDSTVVEFTPAGDQLRTIRVPWGPVSVAHVPGDAGGSLAVICRNTTCLVELDAVTGDTLQLISLGSEPADVLVHPETGHVFVSAAGERAVLELDLAAGTILRRYPIPSLRPTFLALDGEDVLVAPMISGNNSTIATGENVLDPGPGGVLDLEDPTIATVGLKDHDLFRLTPSGVEPVARDMGAVLFAVGVHPTTGQVWQLGTEANNKDRTRRGEPAIRGDFVVNQLAIAAPNLGGVVEPAVVLNLDDQDPGTSGVQYDAARSIGQPYALAFSPGGAGFVAGLLSSNVVELDSSGALVREWDVAPTPRGLLTGAGGDELYVYSWGDNVVQRFDLGPTTPTLLATLDLGHDPTPAVRAEGRQLFFDGGRSLHANASCASCHVEGDSDLLPWDLSDLPYDDKGPLVTQFMRGIADLTPFHWRGERAGLIDFNPAFDGLMGGPPLSPGEFEAFERFIFSIEQPANPNQDERRVVVNKGVFQRASGLEVAANAVKGQDLYFDHNVIIGVGSCASCHTMPTGTSNEVFFDEPGLDFAPRTHFVVASYNGMWRKDQRTLERIQLRDGTWETRPTIGAGFSTTGLKDDLLEFIEVSLFSATQKQRQHLAAFVQQADSGLAPAVHEGLLLGHHGTAQAAKRLREYLLRQAELENCDVVAYGIVDVGAGPVTLRWWWDPTLGRFRSEDSSVAPRTLTFFIQQAAQGTAQLVFLGLPVGMGERFGVDFDLDGLYNADELSWGTDPEDPDSDGDGDLDGHEVEHGGDPNDPGIGSDDQVPPTISAERVLFVTNTVAKIQFQTDELCTFEATWSQGNQSGGVTSDLPERHHTVILRGLRPDARIHDVELLARDLSGNTSQLLLQVTTLADVDFISLVLRDAAAIQVKDSGGTLHYRIEGKARSKSGTPISGRRLRVNVFVNGVLTQELLEGTTSPGSGLATVDVIESGLAPGDEVTVSVFDLYSVAGQFGGDFSLPDTAPQARRWELEYTGTGL